MTAVNPFARRRRLAAALAALREARGWNAAYTAQRAGINKATVSRLEKVESDPMRRPDLLSVHRLLDAFGIEENDPERKALERLCKEVSERRWWDAPTYRNMGVAQELFALVELGAVKVDEYAVLLPGTVQTEDYATHRVLDGGAGLDATSIVAGRIQRQRQAAGQGTQHRLIVEPQAVERMTAPPRVMAAQLRHLLALVEAGTVEVQVLPVDADLSDGHVPLGVFAHLSYPATDPDVVIVDNVAERPALIVDADEVKGYAQLFDRLRAAALSLDDSAAFIAQAADRFGAAT